MTSIVTSRSVKPCCANRSTSFWSAVLTRTKPCMSIWTASPYPQLSANGGQAKLRKFILTATSIPVPLRDNDDALLVNWCEITVTRADGKQLYKNDFATDHWITDQTVAAIVQSGRTRWKVENENNNTLKTKGYNLEHNFGHGKQHLASLLATFNLLSLLFHTRNGITR